VPTDLQAHVSQASALVPDTQQRGRSPLIASSLLSPSPPRPGYVVEAVTHIPQASFPNVLVGGRTVHRLPGEQRFRLRRLLLGGLFEALHPACQFEGTV
jgi:hypothetical protein